MKGLTIEAIIRATGGTYYPAGRGEDQADQTEVTCVVTDSRQITPGGLFIPVRGERVDGHTFIPQVFEKGASLTLSEEVLFDAPGPYVLVKSSLQALKDIAKYYRSTLQIPVIGISGSVGKTSTKEMIACVLSQKYNVLKTDGNFNNEIGMPLTLLRIRKEHTAAVIEMGISDFGEMHRLADVARPDICVLTNIGQAHLEFLKDRDGILRAKSEIFDFLKPDGAIVLNGNDDKLSTIGTVGGVVPMRYYVADGTFPKQEGLTYAVTADKIRDSGLFGMEAELSIGGEICKCSVPIPGIHNIYNACAAACVGQILGLTKRQIIDGIAQAETIAGRSHLIRLADEIHLIDDCYNANPVSMEASIDLLSLAPGRKIAVLGDMGELGENEAALHVRIGAYVRLKGIDVLFCTGDLSRHMAQAAKGGDTQVSHFPERDALIEALLKEIRPGDTILVKASHFMGYEKVVKAAEEAYNKPQD